MLTMLQKSGRRPCRHLVSRLAQQQRGVTASAVNQATVSRRRLSTSPRSVSSTITSTISSASCLSSNNIYDVPSPAPAKSLTIGILRETYDDWERRTPLCPHHVEKLVTNSSKVLVQPSSQRCFSDLEYEQAGAVVSEDLAKADIILGVKRPVDPESMLDDKTYVFFSHVIKGQESNMGLLQRVLDKNIQLVDYECIVDQTPKQNRLVAFGKYAGLAGMIDTLYPLGRRLVTDYGVHTPFLQCPLASMQQDLAHAQQTIQRIGEQIAYEGLPQDLQEPLVFGVTGLGGRVFGGAMEILDLLPQERVSVDELPDLFQQSNFDPYKVYTVAPSPSEMYHHRSSDNFSLEDWRANPTEYQSKFATHIAPYVHSLVNCIYWDARYARLLTKDEVQTLHENGQNRLLVVSDISCDVNGSIEFLDRTCTIDKPFFQYDPLTRQEVTADIGNKGITVMGTDILPAELPKESSDHFGTAVVKVLDELFESRSDAAARGGSSSEASPSMDLQQGPKVLSNACITTNKGELAPRFQYLDSFLQMAPSKQVETSQHINVLLNGHLFDSGLINTILDEAEVLNCGFNILNCRVNRGGLPKDVIPTEKSTALVQFSSDCQENLDKLETKIQALVDVMVRAEASAKVVDRSNKESKKSTNKNGSRARGGNGGTQKRGFSTASVESQPEQKVLVLGAGRVSMSLVDLLGRTAQKHIQVASDNDEEAKAVAKLAQRGNHVALDLTNQTDLGDLIKGKDVVISLLPAPMHPTVAEECIRHGTNLVTASYESPAMKEMHERAKQAGIFILNEVGLDPGLDHMSAMKIIDDVRSRGGSIRSFQSVCGGLPAPEAANNPLQYKFSWSPKGVITASQNSARYRWNNEIVEVDGMELMESVQSFDHPTGWNSNLGGSNLECLPNRDSLKYERIYGIDEKAHTLFRGTLRYGGFCSLMSVFQKMGLFQAVPVQESTWSELLETLRSEAVSMEDSALESLSGQNELLMEYLWGCAGGDSAKAEAALEALEWLEMTSSSDTPVSHPNSLVDSFCQVLEDHLQFEEGERDMVAMHTTIEATFDDGASTEIHQSSLLAFGDDQMSAMCRTVGMPAAAGADLILSGGLQDHENGLVLPTEKEIYLPILATVEKEGIVFEESVTTNK